MRHGKGGKSHRQGGFGKRSGGRGGKNGKFHSRGLMQFENVDYRPFNVAKSYGHLASDGERSRSSAQEDRSAHEARSAGAGLGGGADSDTQNVK